LQLQLYWEGDRHLVLIWTLGSAVLPTVTYSPTHFQAGAPVINIQSTLHITPDLCKNVSHAVSFGSNSNSYTVSMQSGMCIYTRILVGQKKLRRIGTVVNATCHFGHTCHRFATLAIASGKCDSYLYFLADPLCCRTLYFLCS
jgi:hypothetical protein